MSKGLADWSEVSAVKPATSANLSQTADSAISVFLETWHRITHSPSWFDMTMMAIAFALLVAIWTDMIERSRNKRRLLEDYRNWLSWPTMEEYLRRYPETRTNRGVICKNCKSGYVRNTTFGILATQRVIACKACAQTMYRLPCD